jgi:hypothetical protein
MSLITMTHSNKTHLNSTSGEVRFIGGGWDQMLNHFDCPCFGPKPSSLDEKRLQPFFLS